MNFSFDDFQLSRLKLGRDILPRRESPRSWRVVDVESDHVPEFFSECHGHGQAHIAQSDNGVFFIHEGSYCGVSGPNSSR